MTPGARIDLLKVSATGSANVTQADFNNNSALYFSGVYQASDAAVSYNDVIIVGQGTAALPQDQFDRQTAGAKLWTVPELPSSGAWIDGSVARNGVAVFVSTVSSATAVRSSDWGRTWEATTLPAARVWRSVTMSGTAGVAIAQATDKGAYTFDGGNNWVECTLPTSGNWETTCHTDERTFIALRFGSNVGGRSTNGGATWSGITLPASRDWNGVASLGRVTPTTANTEILIAVAGATDKAARSTDGGQTWAEITLPSSADWRCVVPFTNSIVCVLGLNAGARSTNGGVTWSAIASFPGSAVWRQASALSTLRAIATDSIANTAYIETTNAGALWTVKTFAGSAVARSCNASPYRL
jgi:hypothetical protein